MEGGAGAVKGQEEVRDDGPPLKKRRRGEAEGQQGVEMEGGAGGVGRDAGDGVKEHDHHHHQQQQHAQREELQLEKTGEDGARQQMQ